jgi:outer membrane lipoprotein LolB
MMRAGVAALLAAALAGCASLFPRAPAPEVPPEVSQALWQQHRKQLAKIGDFALNGRIASGMLGRADLYWKQQANGRFSMRVSGPLGVGAAELSGNARQVRVRTAQGEEFTTDPEAWLQQQFGWSLPVRGLRWWALGLPAPGIRYQLELDAEGRAARIVQNGWDLSYTEYQEVDGIVLPKRVEAVNGENEVRLLADRWENTGSASNDAPASPSRSP